MKSSVKHPYCMKCWTYPDIMVMTFTNSLRNVIGNCLPMMKILATPFSRAWVIPSRSHCENNWSWSRSHYQWSLQNQQAQTRLLPSVLLSTRKGWFLVFWRRWVQTMERVHSLKITLFFFSINIGKETAVFMCNKNLVKYFYKSVLLVVVYYRTIIMFILQ